MPQLDNNSPFTLVANTPLTLTQPGQGAYPNQQPPAWVILQNDSTFSLSWFYGSNSGGIQPLGQNVILLTTIGLRNITVIPGATGAGQLVVTWSLDGDPVPTNYPTGSTSLSATFTDVGITDPNVGADAIPQVATEFFDGLISNTISTIIPAPAIAWYVFGADFLSTETDGSNASLSIPGGNTFGILGTSSDDTAVGHIDLNRIRITTAIMANVSTGIGFLIVRYAPGP